MIIQIPKLIAVSVIATCSSQAMAVTITDLGVLSGDISSYARSINNKGEVVGNSFSGNGYSHAFIYTNNGISELGSYSGYVYNTSAVSINDSSQSVGNVRTGGSPYSDNYAVQYYNQSLSNLFGITGLNGTIYPGMGGTSATSINNNGQVAASQYNSGYHAVIVGNGVVTNIGTLGGNYSYSNSINDQGQVVGSSNLSNGNGISHAFLYSNGSMTDLGTIAGGVSSSATSINEKGQVVGSSAATDGNNHAFLYDNGNMLDLGTLNGFNSVATSINENGQIVGSFGFSENLHSYAHAFLYSNGTMFDLNTLAGVIDSGWNLIDATAINDLGQIVGQGQINGQYHAYMLSSVATVPVPASIVLIASGLLGFLPFSRRKCRAFD